MTLRLTAVAALLMLLSGCYYYGDYSSYGYGYGHGHGGGGHYYGYRDGYRHGGHDGGYRRDRGWHR